MKKEEAERKNKQSKSKNPLHQILEDQENDEQVLLQIPEKKVQWKLKLDEVGKWKIYLLWILDLEKHPLL